MLAQKPLWSMPSFSTYASRSSLPCACGIGQVAGQQVEQGRDVGRALDARRARAGPGCRRPAGPCCPAAAAGSPRRGCTARRPCGGSSRRCRRTPWSAPGRSCSVTASHTWRKAPRDAADLLHHLRGVAGEVPLEHLEHAARVLQRLVAVRRRCASAPPEPCASPPAPTAACRAAVPCSRLRRSPAGGRRRRRPRTRQVRSRRSGAPGRSRRTRRRGPRCPRSPRSGSSTRWCRRARTRGSTSPGSGRS